MEMTGNGLALFTIGHSTHPWERFAALLAGAGISAVADLRSTPWSRHTPRFNREALEQKLPELGIAYVHLGRELGGRPQDPSLYVKGRADYEKVAKTALFQRGLERVMKGGAHYRLALMCAEQHPLDCHRCLLVGRALHDRGVTVNHILADGTLTTQPAMEDALLELAGRSEEDMWLSRAQRVALAYRERNLKGVSVDAGTDDPSANG